MTQPLSDDSPYGDIISAYTAADAVADGSLVDVTRLGVTYRERPIAFMTAGLWAEFQPFLLDLEDGPSKDEQLASALRTKLRLARTVYAGEAYALPPNLLLKLNDQGSWTLLLESED